MSAEIENMTDEQSVKWQEELYELESSAIAGPLMSEEEIGARSGEFLAGDRRKKRREAAVIRREELKPEIALASDLKKKERWQQELIEPKEQNKAVHLAEVHSSSGRT